MKTTQEAFEILMDAMHKLNKGEITIKQSREICKESNKFLKDENKRLNMLIAEDKKMKKELKQKQQAI